MNGSNLDFQTGLTIETMSQVTVTSLVPLATPADFENADNSPSFSILDGATGDNYTCYNVATCPDCSGGMMRQGKCCVCPSCGFESCLL